jgi:hypothetical protein
VQYAPTGEKANTISRAADAKQTQMHATFATQIKKD